MAELLSNKYKRIPLSKIIIDRDKRQRSEITIEDLVPSIQQNGVLIPIIVEPFGDSFKLIAGERRFMTCKFLSHPDIPARLSSELSETERQLIELEENVKRKELPWSEQTKAISTIHKLLSDQNETWTQQQTADYVGVSLSVISKYLSIQQEIDLGTTGVLNAKAFSEALTATKRSRDRRTEAVMSNIVGNILEPKTSQELIVIDEPPASVRLINGDSLEFMENYTGSRFNLLHFDLPYDVKLSEQAGQHTHVAKYDGENLEIFLETIAANFNNIAADSCHVLFWFPMKHYERIRLWLISLGLTVDANCYIWNKHPIGIVRDHIHFPRNVYEPCFIAYRGARPLAKLSVNLVSCIPDTATRIHASAKPQQVMQHLLSMFVDEHTRMFDPTAGSGSALLAAETICPKITQALGFEIDEEFFKAGNERLIQARKLAELSRKVSK